MASKRSPANIYFKLSWHSRGRWHKPTPKHFWLLQKKNPGKARLGFSSTIISSLPGLFFAGSCLASFERSWHHRRTHGERVWVGRCFVLCSICSFQRCWPILDISDWTCTWWFHIVIFESMFQDFDNLLWFLSWTFCGYWSLPAILFSHHMVQMLNQRVHQGGEFLFFTWQKTSIIYC